MIDKEKIKALLDEKLAETDCFLVSLKVSTDNNIQIDIDSETSVDLDFCVSLNRFLEESLDRDSEDFSLEVGSYSISEPFVDIRQYHKNIGRGVEVLTPDSKKLRGTLISVDAEHFSIEIEEKIKVDGHKRKQLVCRQIDFNYNEVKYTKLDFSSL